MDRRRRNHTAALASAATITIPPSTRPVDDPPSVADVSVSVGVPLAGGWLVGLALELGIAEEGAGAVARVAAGATVIAGAGFARTLQWARAVLSGHE